METEKANQAQDFANRQQEIDRVQKEKEALHAIELEEARDHGKTESHKGASLGGGGQRSTCVKLPKLDFPKFFGDVTKWKEFWDCYDSAIHTNSRLSTIDKLNYLRSEIDGEALGVIGGLPLTAENYELP